MAYASEADRERMVEALTSVESLLERMLDRNVPTVVNRSGCNIAIGELRGIAGMIASGHAFGGEPEPTWQPIATAPKDESEVLLLWANATHGASRHAVETGRIGPDGKLPWHDPRKRPTHWMPLPVPPKEAV